MHTKRWLACALALWFLLGHAAFAHLRDPNVPPCFEMRDEQVVKHTDTSGQNSIVFSVPEIAPPNRTAFAVGEYLNIAIQLSGQLCSPYFVFIETQQSPQRTALIQQTSPSLPYPPGRVERRIKHSVTFAVDPLNPLPNAVGGMSSVRIVVAQYGSYKKLASYTIPLTATWRAPANLDVPGFPEYECADDMRLPPVVESPARCSNSLTVPNGATQIDLNGDGICERIVRDENCDKTHGNRCFRVLAERSGDWQPIAQFYNKLTQHSSDTGYRALSSLELGPLSNVTRFSEWRGGAYATHMYLHDCSRLPQ